MRNLYILLLVSFYLLSAQAQTTTSTKLGRELYTKLQDPKYAQSSQLKGLMVKGDPGVIGSLVAKYDGILKFSAGDISSVSVPYKNLISFSQEPGIVRIEGSSTHGKRFMDTARIVNNIDSAQIGYAPLSQAYKGTGVLMGIIDGGIYFRHQDFRRANGNSRILYLWDQYISTGTAPAPFGYGSEWDSAQINAGQCTSLDPSNDFSHGTNVAGIAAGNGSSWDTGDAYLRGRYTGVAPDADMIVVRYNDTSSDFTQVVADGVNYIFSKATALGRPCVVNTSEGTYYGSHDGQDLTTQSINAMLSAQTGRVLVAAAGNSGGLQYHVSYPLSSTDSLFTWFTYYHRGHIVYYDLWADTSQFKQANFAIGCDNMTPTYLGRTKYYNVITDFNPAQGVTAMVNDSLMQGSTNLGYYNISVTLSGGTYHVEFTISPSSPAYLWRLQTFGQGIFDAWVDSAAIGGSSPVRVLPNGFSSPNYRFADSLKTIVSSWQCSDQVITVGNFASRNAYLDIDSVYVPSGVTDGSLMANSSIGPTRDGRIKPDIGATGTIITATGDSGNIATLLHAGHRTSVSIGGKHNSNGGTSMASPIVAGVAALYLQEHPTASYSEVKHVIEVTARHDAFTTLNNIPNVNFGWGKVNGFRALTYTVVYGCMDTGSVNYNPAANTDTGGCIPKVYGCTDTGSINYNHLANVNNGTCIRKIYGCTDTASINFDSVANVNNGSCIAKVYGCTDTDAINYDAAANVNNGSCILKVYGITDTACSNYNPHANVNSGICIPLGIAQVAGSSVSFDVVPNPVGDNATITISSSVPLVNASIVFYDLLGKKDDAIAIPTGATQVTYINNKLAPGIYNAALVSDGRIIATKKIVAE